jgi:S-DNA-T family DNA segregation ATPase FtsK/SpoIIIE
VSVERTLSVIDPHDPVGSARHITLKADLSTPAAEIRDALAPFAPAGAPLFVGSSLLPTEGTLEDLDLPTGSVVGWGSPVPPLRIERPWTRYELRVVGGPAAGRVFPLPPGVHELGRSGSGLVVPEDHLMSRKHLRLSVDDGGVQVEDLGSSNGTLLDGAPLEVPTEVAPGALLYAGTSLLEVTRAASQEMRLLPQPDGRLGVNRRFRTGDEELPGEVTFPSKLSKSERPKLNLALTLAPAGVMLLLVLVMLKAGAGGKTMLPMMMMMGLSPLIGISSTVSRRKEWDKQNKETRAEFAQDAGQAAARLLELRAAEVQRLRRISPDPAATVQCARTTGRLLWARRGTDDDLLSLRVGSGIRRSAVRAQGASVDDPFLWMAPVTVPLTTTGGVGIIGPVAAGRALARNLLLQATTLHSPSELRVVVVSSQPNEAEWGWVRWLPHARWASDDPFLLVGNDPVSLRTRLAELKDLVKRRQALRKEKANQTLLPLVLVVYDGAGSLVQQGFAEILRDGPAVGVHAICVDEVQVPEGCDAAVTIGDRPDTTKVEQAGQPVQENVLVDLVATDLCDIAARCLAPLRLVGEDGVVELPPQLRLLELLDLPQPTPEQVLAGWQATGRTPAAPVGLSTTGPLYVDLTRDGPHGVIAGASRSGKSEFLKTFIASLAARNHPDDLSFLFIDFKGGNDYQVAARLPHTVDLATQIDQAGFERSLQLLDAEIVRRQQIALQLQTSTIEGYWSAQANQPPGSSPVMGRLVVIVDEFAELAQKSPEQLDRLVSVARVGAAYGVHLILATQRPAGVVSGQIDANAPLRVCFRTTQAEHSTDVLGQPDAAEIAERHRGRGYKKAHQEQLQEFQCARVGNARPGTAAAVEPLEVSLQEWQSLGHIPPEPESLGEVPDPETDFFELANAIVEAARMTGWERNAVPWPKPLPDVVSLEQLPEEAPSDRLTVPFALVDDPAQQAHLPAPLVFGAGHVAIAGSSGTGRTSALRTAALSAAVHAWSSDVHLYALDFPGGGLAALSQLPHCAAVASDDPEVIGRILDRLDEEIRTRRGLFEAAGTGDLLEYNSRASDGQRLPWMLLLIDGWEIVHEDSQTPTGAALHDRLLRLLGDGQRFGLQGVVAGDRWTVSGRLGRVMTHRYLLRFNAAVDYDAAGVRAGTVPERMPPGRCIGGSDGRHYQLGVLGDGTGAGQAAAIHGLVEQLREREQQVDAARRPRRIEALPVRVSIDRLLESAPMPEGATVPVLLGFAADVGGGLWLDLAAEAPTMVVTGRRRSGRSTALLSFAHSARRSGVEVVVVAPKSSPLTGLAGQPGVLAVHEGDDAITTRLTEVAGAARVLVLVDDADALDPTHIGLGDLLMAPQPGRAIVVAATTEYSKNAMSGFLATARRPRNGIVLWPESPYDGGAVGAGNLPRGLLFDQPAGRGVLSLGGEFGVLQIPLPAD